MVAGTISTAIGILGIFVPILPTTPFLLLAAACYIRSSERFYRWLLNNRIFGVYISNYIEGKGMILRVKLFTIFLLWVSIGIAIWIGTQNLVIRIVLALVAAGVTLHIISIKARRKERTPLMNTKSADECKSNNNNLGEKLLTKEIYDEIAPEWYNFRHRSRFQTELEALARRWRGGKLLNVGCAHGPDFLPFRENFELYGVDFSIKMLELARQYAEKFQFQVNLVEADARKLPYDDAYFDWAIGVATYHHIEGDEDRLQAFRELKRVLKPGGEAFVTAWNKWQPRFWLKKKDILMPWKSKEKTLYRYYHLFSYRELESIMRKAGFEMVKSYPESSYRFPIKTFSRNACVLVRKKVTSI
jgi:uncharacterized membrane protein YbaN (DUF454 family)/ubiquinone/menaquinone biosynthesis C-methylase UbiE